MPETYSMAAVLHHGHQHGSLLADGASDVETAGAKGCEHATYVSSPQGCASSPANTAPLLSSQEQLHLNGASLSQTNIEIARNCTTTCPHPNAAVNMNLRSAFIHVLGDLLQSVGVVLASIIIYIWPSMTIVDPICTFLFSGIVLWTTFRLFQEAVHVLMEATPLSLDASEVQKDMLVLTGVTAVHDLHIWTISPGKLTCTAHVRSGPGFTLSSLKDLLSRKYKIRHSTIELE